MYDRYVRFHARLRPDAVAVATLRGEVSYRAFDADIDRVAAALVEAGVRPAGSEGAPRLVGVSQADLYCHWVLLMALVRLGLGTTSFPASIAGERLDLLAPELWITDVAPAAPPAAAVIHATTAWMLQALARPAVPMPVVDPDPQGLARVTTSSGTTGLPKKIPLRWAQTQARQDSVVREFMGLEGGVRAPMMRTLSAINVESGLFEVMQASWALGGALLLAPSDPASLLAAIQTLRPTTLIMAPIQCQMLLDALAPGFAPQPGVVLHLMGSHASHALRRAAMARLTPNVRLLYGSTEGGIVSHDDAARLTHDEMSVGLVQPAQAVQIVDDEDALLPPGAVGAVRTRTQTSPAGYLDDPEATARAFKDGWFYPGDLGSLSAQGELRILGRTDEVLNFGGEKFSPLLIETPALACAGVRDAAAFVMRDAAGLPRPWLAVVRGEGLDEAALDAALHIRRLPPVHVAWIEAIPRNERGKVLRDRLQAAAAPLNAQANTLSETDTVGRNEADIGT